MKKVLVLGASGFVGQNIVETLGEKDLEVTATDIMPMNIKTPSNTNFIGADILDNQHVEGLVEGKDIIIHLATSNLTTSLKNPRRNIKINVQGTMNILEAARKYGVEKIIYSSASSIYGVPEYLPVNEVHPKKPTTIYGVGKYAGEHMLRVYKELHGINYFVLRFTNVYGPYQHPDTRGLIPVVMTKILKGEEVTIFGDGSQTRDFVYVKDLAILFNKILADNSIKNSIVNAGSGVNTTILDAAKLCGKVLDIKPNFVFKPQEGGERKAFQADITKCGEVIGQLPDTDLESGLKQTAEWIKLEFKKET